MLAIDWQEMALCAGSELDFYTESANKIAVLKAMCGECPVSAECLAFAIQCEDFEPTVYGGLTGKERKALCNA